MHVWWILLLAPLLSLVSGRRHQHETSRVLGGKTVDIMDYPATVAIFYFDMTFLGTGGIISKQYILTAAHVIYGTFHKGLSAVAGTSTPWENGTMHLMQGFDIHPKFNRTLKAYDVAVMKCLLPIVLDDVHQVAPLGLSGAYVQAGSKLRFASWGEKENGFGLRTKLQGTTLTTTSDIFCRIAYPELYTNKMICAGQVTSSPCRYDDGALLLDGNIAVGIYVEGFGCGIAGNPHLFTSIVDPDIRQWIKDMTKL